MLQHNKGTYDLHASPNLQLGSRAVDRFWSQVEPTGFCWLWRGSKNGDGYGIICVEYQKWAAYRLAYTLLVGDIPEGLVIDHLCRVKLCVNPDHLEPVTAEENFERDRRIRNLKGYKRPDRLVAEVGESGKLISCRKGHPLGPDNVLLTTRKRGNGPGSIRARCMACQHGTQDAMRARSGVYSRGRRGSYGPRRTALFEPYWGFSYEDWAAGRITFEDRLAGPKHPAMLGADPDFDLPPVIQILSS